ncbi:MAG: hypothetical protein IIC13_05890 [SAR324 cluster bacterium]|nr:hypothetical protein [SAR324 cluster bacterium]MCH8886101.1 hypothetical protein [SAR324 cluster bacterium]
MQTPGIKISITRYPWAENASPFAKGLPERQRLWFAPPPEKKQCQSKPFSEKINIINRTKETGKFRRANPPDLTIRLTMQRLGFYVFHTEGNKTFPARQNRSHITDKTQKAAHPPRPWAGIESEIGKRKMDPGGKGGGASAINYGMV